MQSEAEIMGKWFKFYRQLKGFELADISYEMKTHIRQIEAYENGENEMPLEFIAAACALFEIKPDAFFMGVGKKGKHYLELLNSESLSLLQSFSELMETVKIKQK